MRMKFNDPNYKKVKKERREEQINELSLDHDVF